MQSFGESNAEVPPGSAAVVNARHKVRRASRTMELA
jgi:hypothetical protein